MRTDENYKDDLEYLSQQGFEKVTVGDDDFSELKKRIAKRSFSFRPLYFIATGLVIGVFIGIALFFGLSKSKNEKTSANKENVSNAHTLINSGPEQKIIELDTVLVVKENFINPSAKRNKPLNSGQANRTSVQDSADVIITKPLDLSLLNQGALKEEKLKYMINSPVFYLHDMKITNYTTLYFKKNRFVKYTGLSAAYSGTAEAVVRQPSLKQEPDYYLHEEIATAMLYFKKGKYDQAINSLKLISSYNDDDLNCDFYLAMSYYYKKKYNRAIELFDLSIINTNNTFLQESMYYKALSLYESGNKESAKILFKKIAEEDEFYAEKCRVFLKEN